MLYDEPVRSDPMPAPAVNWTGAYGGVLGGVTSLRGSFVISGTPDSTTARERFVGAFAGYQQQLSNNVVLGIEGSVRYGLDKTRYDFPGVGSEIWTDWGGTIRARVGYAFDRALIYATGGWGVQRNWVDSTVIGKDSDTQGGYVLGLGVEYALSDKVFGRLEYQYADFPRKQVSSITEVDLAAQTFMVGIGTRF